MKAPLQGLVSEAYGAGDGPADNPDLLAAVEAATAQGIVGIVVTQCARGLMQPGVRDGIALVRAGAGVRHDLRGGLS
ncbi:MAG TPA: hypothetical protein VFJ28_05105 [Marmoricola sp.]|nr:hypothetical protein [Marmoricola sp.]